MCVAISRSNCDFCSFSFDPDALRTRDLKICGDLPLFEVAGGLLFFGPATVDNRGEKRILFADTPATIPLPPEATLFFTESLRNFFRGMGLA